VVFDMAHGEVFAPGDTSELGQSRVVEKIQAAGYEVRVNTSEISTATLDGAAAIYVPGPMRPFTEQEKTALDEYLERGGTVVLSIHVPYPVLATPARWGLPVGTAVMQSTEPVDNTDAGVFVTTEMAPHPLTKGVNELLVVSGWPLSTDPTKLATAELVVTAGPSVVVDGDDDGAFSPADPQPPYGVVGVAPVGSGQVIVLGDDALLANIAIDEADNATLLDNILELIGAPKGA